ncbi:MAG TPA: hypothetical protein VJ729_02505 [Nitrososphaeraceae archaeon]|nr:hypothetical protein [Nitrososphaeraceae archaeon]
MNHTTLGTIVAISVIAALTVGVAIVSTPKAFAAASETQAPITTSIQGAQVSDQNGNPIISTTVPNLSEILPNIQGLLGQVQPSAK